jgi:midasin
MSRLVINNNYFLVVYTPLSFLIGLRYASKNYCKDVNVSAYDGLCLSFLTDLDRESSIKLENFIKNKFLSINKSLFTKEINRNRPRIDNPLFQKYKQIEGYWIMEGGEKDMNKQELKDDIFVFTKTVSENLKHLARTCSAQLSCLIQGDTSIGKTSLIKWLAKETNNSMIRINNHDHTDLQEYIGSYVLNENGKLVFKEGLLIQAMKNGYWILLDKLNLASSDVLEALNRVLDDNREIFIPEIQETVKAHPKFILFATQNPPKKYPGRKQLSKAFRNRFIELHFDDLPLAELNTIVEKKCKLPPSYTSILVKTVFELQTQRSQQGIFAGKNSLITLRDLFRWAKRYTDCKDNVADWKQYLAENGLLILASRCRKLEDAHVIHKVIEKVFKVKNRFRQS